MQDKDEVPTPEQVVVDYLNSGREAGERGEVPESSEEFEAYLTRSLVALVSAAEERGVDRERETCAQIAEERFSYAKGEVNPPRP